VTAKRKSFIFNLVRMGLALGISFFLVQIQFDSIEAFFYDMRVRLSPTTPPSGYIQTIAVDVKTQEALKHVPDAKDLTRLLQNLVLSQPKAVLFLPNMEELIGSYEDLETLSETISQLNFYAVDDTRLPEEGLEEDFKLLPPLQNVRLVSAPKTGDVSTFAKDGVTRRVILSFKGEPLLHEQLAGEINGLKRAEDYRGHFQLKRTEQTYIDFRPAGTYAPLSFIDVQEGRFDPKTLKDKIIFIGRDTRAEISDYVMTPHSRDTTAMSRLELHANALDTLINNSAPIKSPQWLDFLATALISILTIFVVMAVRPTQGLLVLLGAVAAYTVFAFIFFASFGLWIDMTHPMLAFFICYYFFIPYRLIVENRRSWEYYQKHTILSQVEELKSNFLRMMSHDVKTPVARIQAMAELTLRDPNPLSQAQTGALQNISQSVEELSSFFGSILSLGRIESKEIELHLKSKDINVLLQEVLQKCEYLAKDKNIRIVTELEPMFSVRVDEDLMRQVFTNLIENAIKYSPEGSSVLISTEESNGQIRVQVADQGIGIPKPDQAHLFSKFYRAKNARESATKGSGLGLYLSDYFVRLHQGKILVESEPERGSTFTVELPMSL
jgi:signal transduction histidine kinase